MVGKGQGSALCVFLLVSLAAVAQTPSTFPNRPAGIKMTHVPYKGGTPAMADTVAGQAQVLCTSVTNAAPSSNKGAYAASA